MCTRYVLLQQHLRALLERLGIDVAAGFGSKYNIAPGSFIPAVRQPARAAKAELTELRWGLIPSWAKDDTGSPLVNARAETLASKPSFRDALRARRCILPASGFYEWEHRGRAKQPWLFRRRDEQPFGLAGLWESWRAPDGRVLETCAVITNEPNELMRPIHDRMPVMLTPEQFAPWLDPRITQPDDLASLLHPPRAVTMTAMPVSTHVSSVRHEGPECIAPAPAEKIGEGPQLSLGLE